MFGDRVADAIRAGKAPKDALWWKYQEHDDEFVAHMQLIRAGKAEPAWPYSVLTAQHHSLTSSIIELPAAA